MNISIVDPYKCTGCMACVARCPVGCIVPVRDNEGFQSPKVTLESCLECGQCYNACIATNKPMGTQVKYTYAAQLNDDRITTSSSGGIGAALAELILEKGGKVYGASIGDDLKVSHIRVTEKTEIIKTCGSKYVQSDFSKVYINVLKDLKSREKVIVFGTPCQIAGLKNFLSHVDTENLYLVDLICHGVPSPGLFEKYISWLENRRKGTIKSYVFRDKSVGGWGTTYTYTYTYTDANGNLYKKSGMATKDPYYEAFLYADIYRESCYTCSFANKERMGDITIGDYWEIKRFHSDFNDKLQRGVSCVLTNTEKGEELLKNISSELNVVLSKFDHVALYNSNLLYPVNRPEDRTKIYKDIYINGFGSLNRRMHRMQRYYINYLKSLIPLSMKKIIKKGLGKY